MFSAKSQFPITPNKNELLLQILKLFTFFQDDTDPEPDLLYTNVIPCVFGDINGLKEKSQEWQIRSGNRVGAEANQREITLSKKLNDIICRLVTDYRAIFAIEVEFSRSFEK